MPRYRGKFQAVRKLVGVGFGCFLVPAVWTCLDHAIPSGSSVMAASKPSFNNQVVPILQKNCVACHSSAVHRRGLVLDSYESLMKGGRHGKVINRRDASGSRIIRMIEGKIEPQIAYDAA